ncbi:MAG: 50S ribosomal protein L7 [Oscillospiraceae bacterium]|nr:50S ribosomal protein L7 [Oscillospiraceae bacterium]
MDRALNYMGLARKGGLIELGEEPVGAVARARKARLVVVAQDATDHTWRRAKSFVAGSEQICLKIPYTKDQLGQAVGRTELALAAFTDPALALAFLKALNQPDRYKTELESLEKLSARIRQRKKEADAHKRNKKMGK